MEVYGVLYCVGGVLLYYKSILIPKELLMKGYSRSSGRAGLTPYRGSTPCGSFTPLRSQNNSQGPVKPSHGFTLVELLVVISIISLLSSVVFASVNSARGKARDAARRAAVRQVKTAIEFYFDANNVYPSIACDGCGIAWAALSTPLAPYISSVVADPGGDRQISSVCTRYCDGSLLWHLCRLRNHWPLQDGSECRSGMVGSQCPDLLIPHGISPLWSR